MLGGLVAPVVLTYVVCWVDDNAPKLHTLQGITWWPAKFLDFDSTALWIFLLWILEMVFWAFRTIWVQTRDRTEMFEKRFSEMRAAFDAKWRGLMTNLDSRDIVFNLDMSIPYSKEHLDDLANRLATVFGPPKDPATEKACRHQSSCTVDASGNRGVAKRTVEYIYAIDATPPKEWWSETLLGYLAILAHWKAQDSPPFHYRQLSRLFGWNPADLLSQLGVKLIVLHRLFGFETYVVVTENYVRERHRLWLTGMFSKISTVPNIDKHFGLKEVLVWEGTSSLDNTNRGFRSFSGLAEPDIRKRRQEADCDGYKAPTNDHQLKWRSFLSTDEADCYMALFMALVSNPCEAVKGSDFIDHNAKWAETSAIFKINTTDSEQIHQILTGIAEHYATSIAAGRRPHSSKPKRNSG